jgi:hypothetical protein
VREVKKTEILPPTACLIAKRSTTYRILKSSDLTMNFDVAAPLRERRSCCVVVWKRKRLKARRLLTSKIEQGLAPNLKISEVRQGPRRKWIRFCQRGKSTPFTLNSSEAKPSPTPTLFEELRHY